MRQLVLASLAFLLCASSASAQVNSEHSLPAGGPLGPADRMFAFNAGPLSETSGAGPAVDRIREAFAAPAWLASPNPPEPPQGVYGVFPKYDWEVSAGYAFVRFYEVSGVSENANGGYGSVVYYVKDWIGAEGEVTAVFGTLSGSSSHLVLGGGGARLRWPASRRFELWGHALAEFANLSPETPYGKATAFAYEAGAGVEISTRHRWGYRVEGDAVGTFFFHTYQVSPKVSVGVVYKF